MNKIEALNGEFTSLRDEVIATIKSISKNSTYFINMELYNEDDENEIMVKNGEIYIVSIEDGENICLDYHTTCLDDLVFIMEKCKEIKDKVDVQINAYNENALIELVEESLDYIFVQAHTISNTTPSNVTPNQLTKFNEIKKELIELLVERIIEQPYDEDNQ